MMIIFSGFLHLHANNVFIFIKINNAFFTISPSETHLLTSMDDVGRVTIYRRMLVVFFLTLMLLIKCT